MPATIQVLVGWTRRWGVWLWLGLVGGFVAWGMISQPLSLQDIASRMSADRLSIALGLIVIGKLLCICLVHMVLLNYGQARGWRFSWYAYSLADIAKYLPGGVWGITGRLHIFRQAKIRLATGGRLILVETLILVLFSFGVGAALLLGDRFGWSVTGAAIAAGLVTICCGLVWPLANWPPLQQVAAIAGQQVLAWLCFGGSLTILADTGLREQIVLAGAFDVGFAVGTLAIFAPSGLGVREFVLAWLGSEAARTSAQLLVELAVVHRLVWIAGDFLVLLPALWMRRSLYLLKIESGTDEGKQPVGPD